MRSTYTTATTDCTDYGHPERAFFKNLELLGLGRHFGLKFFEAFGVFSVGLHSRLKCLGGVPVL